MTTLRQAVQDYLALRRSLGFKLTRVGPVLEDFIDFLAQHDAAYITSDLALAWATQGADGHAESWAAQRLSIVRLFARYRSATDPRTQMPPAGVLPFRERHWAGRAVSSYVFVSSWGNRLDNGDIHRTFYQLSRQIGLRGPGDRHGPRLHDLRHRFATLTLVNWYRAQDDPERRLPLLSAFLGHVHVADTQWYLSGSPELMREAMARLERRWEAEP